MEIIAYEMKYEKDPIEKSDIKCIPFSQKYFQQYMKIYNACFYEMRKSLDNFNVKDMESSFYCGE